MAVVSSFDIVYGFYLCAAVSAVVTLTPSGNVSICANGADISLTCVTTAGPLLWEVETGNQLFNAPHGPTSEGRFDLVVNSVESLVVNNMTVLKINSTATLSNFKRDIDDDIFIKCMETTSGDEKEAVFKSARLLNVTLSRLNNAVNIAWNPTVCFEYVVTIINSSDDSVYPNITTSDTNTTVTLPTGVEFCVTVLGMDSINRTGPASEPQCGIQPLVVTSSISIVTTTITVTLQTSTCTVASGTFSPATMSTVSSTTSTSPTVSSVVGGANAVVIVVPIVVVLLLLLLLIVTVMCATLLVCVLKKRHVKLVTLECDVENGIVKYEMPCAASPVQLQVDGDDITSGAKNDITDGDDTKAFNDASNSDVENGNSKEEEQNEEEDSNTSEDGDAWRDAPYRTEAEIHAEGKALQAMTNFILDHDV